MSSKLSEKRDVTPQGKSPNKKNLNNTEVSYDNDKNVDNAGVQRKNFMEAFGDS